TPANRGNSVNSSFSRGGLCRAYAGRPKAVANPRFRHDVFWMSRIGLQLFPQLVDHHAQALGFLAVIRPPNRLQETAMGQRLSLIGNQVSEDLILFGSEMHAAVAHPYLTCLEINAQIFRGKRRRSVARDRKSTRLNSSHDQISYAVFCLKKKNQTLQTVLPYITT